MIVVNNSTEETMKHKSEDYKMSMEDLFRRELDAYCSYKEWVDETDDEILEMGLEEIMFDEYLHAKFLRDYMIDKGIYTLTESDPHEKKFWKIHKKMTHH
jgi:hypothetical protein